MITKETEDDMKAKWEGQSNVYVAVRVRPLMKHDIIKKSCVKTLGRDIVIIRDPASNDKQDILRANRNREKQYAFDQVFDQNCQQDTIYKDTAKFLIHGVLDGYNATVLAYGQTGSGKVSIFSPSMLYITLYTCSLVIIYIIYFISIIHMVIAEPYYTSIHISNICVILCLWVYMLCYVIYMHYKLYLYTHMYTL